MVSIAYETDTLCKLMKHAVKSAPNFLVHIQANSEYLVYALSFYCPSYNGTLDPITHTAASDIAAYCNST